MAAGKRLFLLRSFPLCRVPLQIHFTTAHESFHCKMIQRYKFTFYIVILQKVDYHKNEDKMLTLCWILPFSTFAAESEISFSVGESVEEFEYYDYFDENKGMICRSAKAGPLIKRVTKNYLDQRDFDPADPFKVGGLD